MCGSLLDVMRGRMVLGVVVGKILLARFPMHSELSLFHTVSDPIEAHVHSLGAFGLDSVIGNAFSCGIVCLDRSGSTLFVAHFL